MEGFVTIGFILICFGHNVWAKDEAKYFVLGKVLELRPPSGAATPITSVQWRHNGNIAAEWASDGGLDIYRNFKGRTVLNTTNGYLIVSKMTEEEAGTYSVEINNNRLDDQYVVRSIEDLSAKEAPKIWVKPGDTEDDRKLDCQGNVENAEPVTYWWNTAEHRSWVQLEKIIVIKNNETTRRMETFSCKIVNPVSERESEPAPNPFYPKPDNSALGAIAIVPILLLVLILAAVGYWKKDYIKQRFCSGKNEVRDGDGNGVVSGEEGVRLKEGAEPTPSQSKPAE